jgi:hypothetical protein
MHVSYFINFTDWCKNHYGLYRASYPLFPWVKGNRSSVKQGKSYDVCGFWPVLDPETLAQLEFHSSSHTIIDLRHCCSHRQINHGLKWVNNTYIHTFYGSFSVSQRHQDVEQVINTQIYTIFTVWNTIKHLKNNIHVYHLYIWKINLQSKMNLYLSIFLRLL